MKPRMRRTDRYITAGFALALASTLALIAVLFVIVDMFQELDRFVELFRRLDLRVLHAPAREGQRRSRGRLDRPIHTSAGPQAQDHT